MQRDRGFEITIPDDYGTTSDPLKEYIFLLIAVGNDPYFNVRRREHPWYGLWIRTLRTFEKSQHTFLYDQYPLWLRKEDDRSSIIGGIARKDLTKRDFDLAGAFEFSLGKLSIPAPFDTGSDSSAPPSPLDSKSAPPLQKVLEFERTRTKPLFSSKAPKEEANKKHKLTDFAIVYVVPRKYTKRIGQNVVKEMIGVLNMFVPVLVEVKYYRYKHDEEHSSYSNDTERRQMIYRAQRDIKLQTDYMFSQRRQPKVIAIAASGPFWRWRVFLRSKLPPSSEAPIPSGSALPSDGYYETEEELQWSPLLLVGTNASDVAFERIQRWVDGFKKKAMEIPNTSYPEDLFLQPTEIQPEGMSEEINEDVDMEAESD